MAGDRALLRFLARQGRITAEDVARVEAMLDEPGIGTMLQDAVEKLRAGITTVEELRRVVQIVDGGGAQCPGCKKEIAEDYSICPHCSMVLRASCGGCAAAEVTDESASPS
jgi:hypothetical protein